MTFLDNIEIEAFRGFAARQAIPLNAGAVVVTGANGMGKTSLTDAVTWVLTDTLPQMPDRQGRRNEEYVVNRYREGSEAEVVLTLRRQGSLLVLSRRGSSKNGSTLSVEVDGRRYVGEEASESVWEAFGVKSQRELDMAVGGWGVLRQDAMRAVLAAPAEELQARLRDILGLGVLAAFEASAKEALKQAADRASSARADAARGARATNAAQKELDDAKGRLADATTRDLTVADVASQLEEFADVVRVPEDLLGDPDGLPELARSAAALESEFRAISLRLTELLTEVPLDTVHDDERRLADLERSVESIEHQLSTARASAAASEQSYAALRSRADGMVELASLALPLISDTCPVCAQDVDPDAVRARLEEVARTGQDASDLARAAQALAGARDAVAALEAQLGAEAEAAALVRARIVRRAQLADQLEELRDRARETATASNVVMPLVDEAASLSAEVLESTVAGLGRLQRVLGPLLRSVRDRAVQARVPRLEQQLEEAQQHQQAEERKLEALARREKDAKGLADAATEAGLDVTQDALEAIEPYFGEVFRRLAAHPTFSELGLEHDVYYGKARTWARLRDPVRGVDANPQLVCSEGQLNVVAMSYFVAFVLAAGSKSLPFVILDDPFQSLDDGNVLGFADLCRHLRDGRQLIATTHDRRFANLLGRKLKPRRPEQRSIHINFASWDEEGPNLEVTHFEGSEGRALLVGVNGHGADRQGSTD